MQVRAFERYIPLMQAKVLQNVPKEHSAMLSTFIKLPFVFKTFVLSNFELPLTTGFTVFLIFFYNKSSIIRTPISRSTRKIDYYAIYSFRFFAWF